MMKTGLSLAVLALIGEVSSIELKYLDRPQDEFADGDVMDGRDLEDEGDPTDDIVDDNGFVKQWDQRELSFMQLDSSQSSERRRKAKPSDEVANGDVSDDKQLEDEGDPKDPIVDDNGFVKQWDSNQRETVAGKKLKGQFAQVRHRHHAKPSDEVANGDVSDDKQLEDEGDPKDPIVDDNGFVKQWDSNQRETVAGKKLKGQFAQVRHRHHEKPSDEVANGDSSENKQVEDEGDKNDDIVDDNGFVNQHKLSQKKSKKHHKHHNKYHHHHHNNEMNIQVDYLMQQHNKFEAVSNLLAIGDDWNNDIGTLPGQTNRGYQSLLPKSYFEQNHILDGHHIQVPRDDGDQPLRNNAHVQLGSFKYSDELANGDSADDRDIHEDEDMNDDVVDYQGQTNAGYGSLLPKTYFEQNHILEGHHIQVPRDESPMRNNAAQN